MAADILRLHDFDKTRHLDPLVIAKTLGDPMRIKTWSLIVTVFGDAIVPRGGSISAVSLGQIMERMGVGSGAVRTAISRLASDGWIERRREGRVSFYRLAAFREKAFSQAAKRIYVNRDCQDRDANGSAKTDNWALVSLPTDITLPKHVEGVVCLQKDWFLVDLSKAELPEAAMIFSGAFKSKPNWFMEMLAPDELISSMEKLLSSFSPVADALDQGWQTSALDALALRCLLIHEWRRIVLKLHSVPAYLMPSHWPELECRTMVASLYCKLLDISEVWLDEEALSANGQMPKASKDLRKRFSSGNFT